MVDGTFPFIRRSDANIHCYPIPRVGVGPVTLGECNEFALFFHSQIRAGSPQYPLRRHGTVRRRTDHAAEHVDSHQHGGADYYTGP